ncbi:MAG: hypothetical protein F4Y63_04605 [Chloroflexi bacterium]|nr:hypothetical protein [Chloroflexota bacterium]MYK60430.1 hypothetical protein [Chloroflexota bacterium]
MATIEDLERRVEALEWDMPTRRGFVAHLHDLDTKFQRLDEGQQRHEQQLRELDNKFDGLDNKFDALERKVDEGFQRLDEKLDILLAQSKIELD